MPTINGNEIEELELNSADRDWERADIRDKINELLLALDGLSFEKKEELEKCPCGGVNGKNHPHAGNHFKEGNGRCTRCGKLFEETSDEKKGGLNACDCKCHIGQVYFGCSDCQKKHYLGQVSEQKPFSVGGPLLNGSEYW